MDEAEQLLRPHIDVVVLHVKLENLKQHLGREPRDVVSRVRHGQDDVVERREAASALYSWKKPVPDFEHPVTEIYDRDQRPRLHVYVRACYCGSQPSIGRPEFRRSRPPTTTLYDCRSPKFVGWLRLILHKGNTYAILYGT